MVADAVADADAKLAHHQRFRAGRQRLVRHVGPVRQSDASPGQEAKTHDQHQTQEPQPALERDLRIRGYGVFCIRSIFDAWRSSRVIRTKVKFGT